MQEQEQQGMKSWRKQLERKERMAETGRLIDSAPLPLTAFEMIRQNDETGVSKRFCDNDEGVVLEGFVFTGGSVACRWRTDFYSHVIFPDWKTFVTIHIGAHPTNDTILRFCQRDGMRYEWHHDKGRVNCG